MNKIDFQNKIVHSCSNHISGLLGEELLRFFLKEKLIQKNEENLFITDKGWEELEIIGINVNKLREAKNKNLNICIESSHGILYEHIGSVLGALLMEKMIELEWLRKRDEKNFLLTDKGLAGLESLGVVFKRY